MLGVRISSINEFRDGKLLYELIHNIFPNVSEAHKSKCDEDNTLLQSKHRMEVVLDILKSEGYASNVEDREKFVCRADGNNAILFVYSILEFIASKSEYQIILLLIFLNQNKYCKFSMHLILFI